MLNQGLNLRKLEANLPQNLALCLLDVRLVFPPDLLYFPLVLSLHLLESSIQLLEEGDLVSFELSRLAILVVFVQVEEHTVVAKHYSAVETEQFEGLFVGHTAAQFSLFFLGMTGIQRGLQKKVSNGEVDWEVVDVLLRPEVESLDAVLWTEYILLIELYFLDEAV